MIISMTEVTDYFFLFSWMVVSSFYLKNCEKHTLSILALIVAINLQKVLLKLEISLRILDSYLVFKSAVYFS